MAAEIANLVAHLKNLMGTVFIIGNGGSATIASHVAVDLNLAGVRAMAFNDPAMLTCLANDFGYEQVFAKQIRFYGSGGDTLIAVSSSGRSPNILNAVKVARAFGMAVFTLTGFDLDNPLRQLGDYNYYVPSSDYGTVEIAHMTMLHSVTDELKAYVTPYSHDVRR